MQADRLLLLALIGLFATLFASEYLSIANIDVFNFYTTMFFLFISGFFCRVLRRKFFFGPEHTLHQAFSFEALTQGAVSLNPQLPYPIVEQAFIRRWSRVDASIIQNWFTIRPISALIIPLFLLGAVLTFAGYWFFGLIFWGCCLLVFIWKLWMQGLRYSVAISLGVLAVAFEGWFWMMAAELIPERAQIWQILLLYFVTLTLFEISSIPFGLGVIELAFFFLSAVFGMSIYFIALPLSYRLFRATPVMLMMLFYLPRYKLTMSDLFNPDLATALLTSWYGGRKGLVDSHDLLVSIVIPAYNEALRLPGYLPKVIVFAQSFSNPTEIIVVDDGSTDGTADYVRSLIPSTRNLQLLDQPKNMGKGAAVRAGVLAARGDYVLFTDADGSTPIEETAKLLAAALEGGDVVIASRRLGESIEHKSLLRGLLSSVFYRLTSLFAVPGIADTQCGFKLFSRESAARLFTNLHEYGWAFDVEILYLAQKLGMTIVEVPVHWTAVPGSKVSLVRDGLRMLRALIRIRRRWKGISRSVS